MQYAIGLTEWLFDLNATSNEGRIYWPEAKNVDKSLKKMQAADPDTWDDFPIKVKRYKDTRQDAQSYLNGVITHSSNYETEKEFGRGLRKRRAKKLTDSESETLEPNKSLKVSTKPIPAPPPVALRNVTAPTKIAQATISKGISKELHVHEKKVQKHKENTASSRKNLLERLKEKKAKSCPSNKPLGLREQLQLKISTSRTKQKAAKAVVLDKQGQSGSSIVITDKRSEQGLKQLKTKLAETVNSISSLSTPGPGSDTHDGTKNNTTASYGSSDDSDDENEDSPLATQTKSKNQLHSQEKSDDSPLHVSLIAGSSGVTSCSPNIPGSSGLVAISNEGSSKTRSNNSQLDKSRDFPSFGLSQNPGPSGVQGSSQYSASSPLQYSSSDEEGETKTRRSKSQLENSNQSSPQNSPSSSVYSNSSPEQPIRPSEISSAPLKNLKKKLESITSCSYLSNPGGNKSLPKSLHSDHREAENPLDTPPKTPEPGPGARDTISKVSGIEYLEKDILFVKAEVMELRRDVQHANLNLARLLRFLMPHEKKLKKPPGMPTPPLRTFDDFDKFEGFLSEKINMDAVIEYLSLLPGGGKTEKTAATNLLVQLLTNELASAFNYEGNGWKVGFAKTKTWKAVEGALSIQFQGSTLNEAITTVKSWLRNAPGRDGGKDASFFQQ